MVPQSDMDFGQYLREARERRGVTLRQIATATRISPRTLEALESNEIRKLPGGIFSRAFVRSYAHEVGLDPDETVRRFLQQFPVSDVTQGSPLVEHVETQAQAAGEDDERQRQVAGLLIALVIGIPLIALIAYFAFSRQPADSGEAGAPGTTAGRTSGAPASGGAAADGGSPAGGGSAGAGTGSAGAPATPAAGTASPGAAGAANDAGAAGAAGNAATATPAPADAMRVMLIAAGPCWVRVSADGAVRYQGMLQRGDRQTVDARDQIYLEVGDAGTLSFTLNGRPGKPLGTGGQVARAHIRRSNLAEWLASP